MFNHFIFRGDRSGSDSIDFGGATEYLWSYLFEMLNLMHSFM
jgi:hypothetical protein